jgi:hypothetical protein
MWMALSLSEAKRVLSWRVKWARNVKAMGLVRESGGMLWNMVLASRWARTMHRIVGGEELPDIMDSVGHWVYVVDMV